MSEQRSREAPNGEAQPRHADEAEWEDRPRPQDEFRSYSLELLAVLEG